jgi:hypothetical protein
MKEPPVAWKAIGISVIYTNRQFRINTHMFDPP